MLTTLIRARRGALATSALGCAALLLSACSTATTGAGADPRAVSQGFIANAAGGCADPWINSAYAETFGRAPSGSGNAGECNVNVYGGGSWTSYDDLRLKVLNSKVCADPWVGQAVLEANRSVGAVLDIPVPGVHGQGGLCNTRLYGFGQWSSYVDLQAKARQTLAALNRQGLLLRSTGAAVVSGKVFNPNQVAIISGSTNQVALASSPRLLPVSGTTVVRNIVAAGGGNIVAAGGGNIVAAGGGNIVAVGGGN